MPQYVVFQLSRHFSGVNTVFALEEVERCKSDECWRQEGNRGFVCAFFSHRHVTLNALLKFLTNEILSGSAAVNDFGVLQTLELHLNFLLRFLDV